MASIWRRKKSDGSQSYMVRWRDPRSKNQQAITFASQTEADTLKRLLDANNQSFEIAQQAIVDSQAKVPTVASVIQEHIDLLVRGTVRTYQTMLSLHINAVLGSVPVDRLDYREITHWIRGMQKKGSSAKTIRNSHAPIFSAMETAVRLKHRPDNPCRGVQLPSGERAEDEARFLTYAQFGLILQCMMSKPATLRINEAWKRDGSNGFYAGPTKTGADKRTVSLNPQLVEMLIRLVASSAGSELLFTTSKGTRISHSTFWRNFWVPAVSAAQTRA